MVADRFHESVEAWEEGKLGRDKKHAEKADAAVEKALDDALGMQMISIRLPKKMIEDLKIIAKHQGLGYQPLIRHLLRKFVVAEFKLSQDAAADRTDDKNERRLREATIEECTKVVAAYFVNWRVHGHKDLRSASNELQEKLRALTA